MTDTLREALVALMAAMERLRPPGYPPCDAEKAARATLAAVQPTQPVAWANEANLISARISRDRGGPFDSHTWSEGPTDYHRTPLYASPQAVQAAPLLSREALIDAIAAGLAGTLHCTRVWSAWQVGTMTEDDFCPVDESDTPAEIADVVLALIAARPQAVQAEGERG